MSKEKGEKIMNTRQISSMIKSKSVLKNMFGGVFSSDMLPSKPRRNKPCCYIANTAHSNSEGVHWVCFFFDNDSPPEFFDSYGRPPQEEFKHFLGPEFLYSDKFVQHPLTSVCGQYCIFYILKRSEGMTMERILALFKSDHMYNDVLVNLTIENYFNIDLDVVDMPYIQGQISRSFQNLV